MHRLPGCPSLDWQWRPGASLYGLKSQSMPKKGAHLDSCWMPLASGTLSGLVEEPGLPTWPCHVYSSLRLTGLSPLQSSVQITFEESPRQLPAVTISHVAYTDQSDRRMVSSPPAGPPWPTKCGPGLNPARFPISPHPLAFRLLPNSEKLPSSLQRTGLCVWAVCLLRLQGRGFPPFGQSPPSLLHPVFPLRLRLTARAFCG